MKSLLLAKWNLFRILRLVFGVIIISQALITSDVIFGIAGLLFCSMAIFNTSCCGKNGCSVSISKNKQKLK